jgi:hypothetical protein
MCLHVNVLLSGGKNKMLSAHVPVSEWLQRIRAEYQEMPGLSLNKEQMQGRSLYALRICGRSV